MHAWPPVGTRLSLLFYERARTCGSTPNGEFLVFGRWGKLGKEEGGGGIRHGGVLYLYSFFGGFIYPRLGVWWRGKGWDFDWTVWRI